MTKIPPPPPLLPAPPMAAPRPHQTIWHGDITIADPWHWLRDPAYPEVKDPDILAYIEAENEYYTAAMASHAVLIESLEQEMRGRIAEEDETVPQQQGDWLYWTAYSHGAEYKKHYRRPLGGGAAQLILDEPSLAEGKDYFHIGDVSVSPDGCYLAFAIDDCGSERFTVHFYDLQSGALLPDKIPDVLSALIWVENVEPTVPPTLLYGRANAQWRTDKVFLHRLGTDSLAGGDADIPLYHEEDSRFTVQLDKTADRRYITLSSGDNETREVRLLPADDPLAALLLIAPRRTGHEYSVEHRNGLLYILTNDIHPNFRIATARCDIHAPDFSLGTWQDYVPASDDFYIRGLSIFRDFFVMEGRVAGLDQIALHGYHSPDSPPDTAQRIAFPEATYRAALGDNWEYHQTQLRIEYDSMITPATVYDYDLAQGRLYSRKVQAIPSGHKPTDYRCERIYLPARDGTQLPVSLLYRADCARPAPLHLYGYGSYGMAIAPSFSAVRLSLVDRGMIAAIAHVRGGDDMGRAWYLAGKAHTRWNSFHDFIDIAQGLIAHGISNAGQIAAEGRSAGGQIMGVICNEAPDLWGAVIAGVPFVDVLNSMLDDSLPLTPGEWSEWGDPLRDRAAFDYIASYSPYDNVRRHAYPPILATAGLHDPRVTYWEAAKWVARLRATRSNDSPLLLRTEMGAGHSGKSGRWQALREYAEDYAFILTQLGVADGAGKMLDSIYKKSDKK